MGWYSTPFNYDGTSPTQVRDDLQKANENFQALSDVFENGTPLSGRIKSSYIPGGGGGSVSGDITVNSVTVSNPNRVNFGIDLSPNASGFYQAAIKMPVGVPGSAIQWQPTSGGWGAGESVIGVDTSGNFKIIGRYNSSGRRVINLYDDVNVGGQLIPISIRLAPQTNQNSLIDLRSGAVDCSGAYILMPTGGVKGNFISWGDPPYDNTLIGVSLSQGNTLVIAGKPDPTKGNRRQIGMWDDVTINGNLSVTGTITGNVVYQVPSTISVKKVDINADANQDYGISFRGSNGFSQSAILMPTGGNGSFINWGNTNPYDCLIGISSSLGQFIIAGKSNGVSRDTHVYENLIVHGYTTSVGFALNTSVAQDYGLNLRGSSGFNQAAILMPMSGKGTFISWGDPAYDNSLIGIQNSTGHFVISGRADAAYGGRRTVYLYDDTIMTGNAYISGNLSVSGTISGNVQLPSTIGVKKIDINADANQDYGIKLSGSFSQTAIWMPVGGYGSTVAWTPVNTSWGADSLIGVNSSGQFWIIGRPTSAGGTRVIYMSDYVQINGDLKVTGNITGNVTYQPPTIITCKKININADAGQDYGLSFRGSNGFSQGAILMPTSGTGSQITWGSTPDSDSLIGVQASTGHFVIFGRPDSAYGSRKTVYIYDDTIMTGNAYVSGNLSVSGTISGNVQLPSTIGVKKIDINADANQDYGLNLRNSSGFSQSAILMPMSGNGTFISWGSPADDNSLVGIQNSTGHFVIAGRADIMYGDNRTVYLYDHLIVNANIYVNGTINQGSDLSMKENVVLFSDSALAIVKSIDVYRYLLKGSKEEHVGFVANYVKDVFPNGVTVSGNGMCSINILDMLALLFKAVKELAEHVANN